MSLSMFIGELFEHGRVRVEPLARGVEESDRNDALAILQTAGEARGLNFPGHPPAWRGNAALWGAEQFYAACQLTVERDADAETVVELLSRPCPFGYSAEAQYTVDLTFQFLPNLHALAKGASGDDPLLGCLERWAIAWPLSSVGMKLKANAALQAESLASLRENAGLWQFYCERIISRRDFSRLDDPAARKQIRTFLGAHRELAPEFFDNLNG